LYTYPDQNDLLTIQLIMGVSEGNYWGESEEGLLPVALDTIKSYKNPKMLDVGCGMGRMFPVFAPYVKSIYALEPDKQRYLAAVDVAASLPEYDIAVKNADSSSLTSDQQFDVVLSSHVLQHIPASVADSMIADIAAHGIAAVGYIGDLNVADYRRRGRSGNVVVLEYSSLGRFPHQPEYSTRPGTFL